MIEDNTLFVCCWWRAKKYVKSVSWWKGDGRTVFDRDEYTRWRTKLHFTTDRSEAHVGTRYEWAKIFNYSKHYRIEGKSFRLEVVQGK